MKAIFSSPFRVYLVISILAGLGLWAGTRLPISLFPNSVQPIIQVRGSYGSLSAVEFRRLYGERIEGELAAIQSQMTRVEKIKTNYSSESFSSRVSFSWKSDPDATLREVQTIVNAIGSTLPEESRRSLAVDMEGIDSFFAMSIYSEERSPDVLYDLIEPLLAGPLRQIKDASFALVVKPTQEEIVVQIKPAALSALGLSPFVLEEAIVGALTSQNGGAILLNNGSQAIRLERGAATVEELKTISIALSSGRTLSLSDLADVNLVRQTETGQTFKTSGSPSLLIYAVPKQGGNVKRMSEEILAKVESILSTLPSDVKSRPLIDPSTFIRSAVRNVLFEVLLGSFLASLVLFVFIGSLRNVITAAIEIPISIALAFIMMWLFDMNLNLLSLAGLALASGMNVDASVVVMENIFRHLDLNRGRGDKSKLEIVYGAVLEVRLSVIASTLASLVVFVPFMFVSGISYAILGDLAKAVLFSHGFSAVVALILVPTVRLHILKAEAQHDTHRAPAEALLLWLESAYARVLRRFLGRTRFTWGLLVLVAVILTSLVLLVLPRLPRELIGKPESDFIVLTISSNGNVKKKQMESTVDQMHRMIFSEMKDEIVYTFDQINGPNNGVIMLKVADSSRVAANMKSLREKLPDTLMTRYTIGEWNPSEFQIPDLPELRIVISGTQADDRLVAAREVMDLLNAERVYESVYAQPSDDRSSTLLIKPRQAQWNLLREKRIGLTPSELTETVRVATQGKWLGEMPMRNSKVPIMMRYPEFQLNHKDELEAFPLPIQGQLIPLKAMADIVEVSTPRTVYVEDGQELTVVLARLPEEKKREAARYIEQFQAKLADWSRTRKIDLGLEAVSVRSEDPDAEVSRSVWELQIAFALSIFLIFLTMLLQFGEIVEASLVMVAVPLGLIGALSALFLFQSTLSINAVLGMIMLNGIAVNNSILLVDFARRRFAATGQAIESCVEAAQQRLRPILITSLTTVLAMLPIAAGFGQGGRILQPLGLAVVGGLGVSTGLTLLLVPALQALAFLRMKRRLSAGSALLLALALGCGLFGIGPHTLQARGEAKAAASSAEQDFYLLLDQLIAKDPLYRKGLEEEAAAREELRPLRDSWRPTFSIEASRRYDRALEDAGEGAKSSYIQGSAQLNIYGFGRDKAQGSQADAGAARLEELLKEQRLMAESAAARRIFRLIAARFDVEILHKVRILRNKLFAASQSQYKKGLLAQQELQKVELDLRTVEINIRSAELEKVKAEADLQSYGGPSETSLGWPLKKLILREPETIPVLSQIERDPASLLEASPSLRTARLLRLEAALRRDFLFAEMMPRLDLQGQVGRTVEGIGVGSNLGSLSLVLSVPLADRSLSHSAYRSQVRSESAADYALREAERAARVGIEESWKSFQLDRASILIREDLLKTARNLYDDGIARFERGLITVNELSGDEDRFYEAERDNARSWLSLHENLLSLCHRAGYNLQSCLASP